MGTFEGLVTTQLLREHFHTYESEMDRLEQISGVHVPSLLSGTRSFLGSVNKWISQGDTLSLQETVVLLPDPTANLSFPYPSDELTIALASSENPRSVSDRLGALAEEFNISPQLLEQPITALSGGERMLISLAKAFVLAQNAEHLCLCSPYFWLDHANRELVVHRFSSIISSHDVRLLLLEGEETVSSSSCTEDLNQSFLWHLAVDQPTVVFPAQNFPRVTHERRITYFSSAKSIALRSPTLLTGRNGVGKTTFAKLLTGLLQPDSGKLQVITHGRGGHARLLLQDTVIHLFGESVRDHLGRVFSFDRELWKEARKIYEALERKCLDRINESVPGVMFADSTGFESMLQCKIAVVVDRLLGAPPLLILDEPGWCLSQVVARAFVETVVEAAHQRGIAVLIISHQNEWWTGLVGDEVILEQSKDGSVCLEVAKHSARTI